MQGMASLIMLLLFTAQNCLAGNIIEVRSPDGNIVYALKTTNNIPHYAVSYKGQILIDYSSLQLEFKEGLIFGKGLRMKRPAYASIDTAYQLLVGKTKNARNHYNEVIVPFVQDFPEKRILELVIRVYNDAVAFRYRFPRQEQWQSYELMEEKTTFQIKGDPVALSLFLPHYNTSHEGQYSRMPVSEIPEDTLIALPVLFEYEKKAYIAITEAALVDYAGMYLAANKGLLASRLSPLPGQTKIKVRANTPHQTPWRVLMISDRVGALIESNVLTSLNEAPKHDFSWLKPGKTTFPWWNGTIVPDTTFAPGNNFETQKYYIDFCADNGIDFHSVVEYGGHEWYVSDGMFYQPGPNADVTRPVPGLYMDQVCAYAKSKGVGIRVWVHWQALYPRIDEAFALYEKWGIQGMMIDFMDRDDQEMVNMQVQMLEKAAKHKLHIQFHGAYKPTGLHRTYPNELTREGTLNYEVNKWGRVSPDHDINIPFTRMLAGATDYHLGGFRAVANADFKVQYTRPLMMGTRCHQLAMYVVLESYLGMICDFPDAYKDQPGFEFLQQVPTVWDETRVVDAKVGEYICIARRKGDDWFVGSITNGKERTIEVTIDFIDEGTYKAELYADHPGMQKDANLLVKDSTRLKKNSKLNIRMAAGGGHAMRLQKIL